MSSAQLSDEVNMILWGKISQFSVFMVLQLLSGYRKSGLLELEDNDERAIIYLKDGYIEAVSVPRSDHLLGARLVKAGLITQADLRKIIIASALKEKREFLGITLMNSEMIEKQAIADVISDQAYENTLELSNWVEGTFKFVIPTKPVVFPISPHINVQHLLLETSRRLDEGQRPTRAKLSPPDEDLCESCLLYTSDAADDLLCVDLGGRRIIKKKKKKAKNKQQKEIKTTPTKKKQTKQK